MPTPRIRLSEEEYNIIQEYRGILSATDEAGLDIKDLKHGWLKTDKASLFFKNKAFDEGRVDAEQFDFKSLFKDVKPFTYKRIKSDCKGLFDKLVFTDTHIGMDASDGGNSMYDLSWTLEDIEKRFEEMARHTIEHKKSNTLYILDLGDYLDGFNAQTTRGGHHLQQNLNNREAFDCALRMKIKLLQTLLPHFDKIVLRNINDDNHGGDFSYTVNSALEHYCKIAMWKVEVINQTKFIEHEIIENYCFVTTHGKDSKHMKFGFKPKLDPKQVSSIVGYLSNKGLLNKGYKIVFEKGDSHQYLFDHSTTDIFDYYNYPALSPSSGWVQLNFQKGSSGFIHFNYRENGKSINEYLF